MCDFHARLIAVAEELGARQVRLEPPGTGENNSRFRRHPHVTGIVVGKLFRFPVPLRPKNTARRRLNYLTKLRRLLLDLGGVPVRKRSASYPSVTTRGVRKALGPRTNQSHLRLSAVPPAPTRLDRDPWAALHALRSVMD